MIDCKGMTYTEVNQRFSQPIFVRFDRCCYRRRHKLTPLRQDQ